jgi:alpha-tubulin suppressor-like RCC1 family protein
LNTAQNRSSPTQIGALLDWKEASAGNLHSLAVKTDGTLWAWGSAASGRLGLDTITGSVSSPVQVGSLSDWKNIVASGGMSIAVKIDGSMWSWGSSGGGRLGLNDLVDRSSPTQIGSMTDWKTVSTGYFSNHAVKTDGSLWSWGNGGSGLGLGTGATRSSPVQIGSMVNWKQVSVGCIHTHAIKTDGPLIT